MTAPAIGIHRMPPAQRIDVGDTTRLNTADVFAARLIAAAPEGGDPAITGMLLRIHAALTDSRVPEAVKDSIRDQLRRTAGDAIAADRLGRAQEYLDDPTLSMAEKFTAVGQILSHPEWCNDCTTGDPGVRFHTNTVGSMPVLGGYTERSREATVQVDRTDQGGAPGVATVFLDTPSTDMTPGEALRLAGLLTKAAEVALRDQAETAAL